MKKKLVCFSLLLVFSLLLTSCLFSGGEGTEAAASENLVAAKNYVFSMYKDNAEATPSDYEVVSAVKIGGESFTVTWTADITSGPKDGVKIVPGTDGKATVDVDEQTPEKVVYKLTATVTDEKGNKESTSFNHYVPEYKEFTWAEFVAAEKDATVVVKGVVTGIISKTNGNSSNGLYLQDKDGGYYVYGMADDPVTLGIKQGYTVRVTGKRDTYSGTYEIVSGSVEILDSKTSMPAPADYTAIYNAAKTLKDAALTEKQSLYVTVKNVIIGENGGSDGSYYYFGGDDVNTRSYVRLSSSVCPLTKDQQAAFKEAFLSHFGYVANVTGILTLYDGAFYLTPVGPEAVEYIGLPQKSNEEKVAFEKDALSIPEKITEDTVLEPGTDGKTYDDVKIAWASDNDCAKVEGGKITFTCPEEDTTVKITATITCGDKSDTREFSVLVEAASKAVYVAEIVENPVAGEAYKLVLFQNTLGQTLYFNGEISGRYASTTDKAEKAVDVYLEGADGKFKMYYTNAEGKKMYIVPGLNASNQTSVLAVEETAAVSEWNAAAKTLFTTVGEKVYYIGTYRSYNTFSVSETSYITGDNAANVDVSQFPARLCTVKEAVIKPVAVETPEAGKPYKLALFQNTLGQVLYFNGEVSGRYASTTDKADKAVDVYLEAADGKFKLYYTNAEGKKMYIVPGLNASNQTSVLVVEETAALSEWNAAAKTLFTTVGEKIYYIGTYRSYNTFSVSETSYITGDNAANVDVSQFPARLVEVGTAD